MRALIFSLFALPLLATEIEYGNPPTFPSEKGLRMFLYGEPFLASLREDGLAFAIRAHASAVLHGKLVEPSTQWLPGFRIGCGTHLNHDSWDWMLDWSYFRNNVVRTEKMPFLTPIFIDASSYAQVPQGAFQEAKEQWTCSINTLCFGLTRAYFLSEELAIAPRMGLLANWIDQNIEVSYRSSSLSSSGVVAYQTSIENNAWKVGPSVGTKIDWYIKKEVRIFGALQGAMLYRRVNARQRENSVGNTEGDFRIFLNECMGALQPWFDTQLGFGWGSYFNCSKNFVEITFQYETQYFWHELYSRTLYQQIQGGQNRFLNNLGDLSMQSASVRIRLDF